MKERIARAICGASLGRGKNSEVVSELWRNYSLEVDAALEEMRNPTEGMLNSAHECTVSGCCLVGKEAAKDIWDEMIQSAIEGK